MPRDGICASAEWPLSSLRGPAFRGRVRGASGGKEPRLVASADLPNAHDHSLAFEIGRWSRSWLMAEPHPGFLGSAMELSEPNNKLFSESDPHVGKAVVSHQGLGFEVSGPRLTRSYRGRIRHKAYSTLCPNKRQRASG